MILVTVGTQLAFPRLVKAVDNWAMERDIRIIAQIGDDDYVPKNMEYKNFYDSATMNKLFVEADLIIAHAGMGTIIQCLKMKKPLLVMPRTMERGEHRNDHQVDTALAFQRKGMLQVAMTDSELSKMLDNGVKPVDLIVGDYANEDLLAYLANRISN